jgi:hypothetical protein
MAAKDMPPPRSFAVNPEADDGEPLCFGIGGPPGSGKTVSALRIATGIGRVRGGRPAVIDTEAGRARKYLRSPRNPNGFDFDYIQFSPPFVPAHFLDAIKEAAKLNPSAIIVDNASDEHEGPGGVLEWHDRMVPSMKGNEWAAWNVPKASRRVLTAGIQQIKIPIILTVRARPKTTTKPGTNTPVSLGYVPVAGDELLGIMDLFCLLPPKSNGVATWRSEKSGEDFAIKCPGYLRRYIQLGEPLSEDLGEALALWQAGRVDGDGNVIRTTEASGEKRRRTPQEQVDAYVSGVNSCEDVEALLAYQLDDRRTAWRETIKVNDVALWDQVVEAQSRRMSKLRPDDEVTIDNTNEEAE